MPATLELHSTGAGSNLGGAADAAPLGTDVNALWDDVASAEAAAGGVEYRAVDLVNTGGAAAIQVKTYISALEARDDNGDYQPYTGNAIALGIESDPIGSVTEIDTEDDAPPGVTFAEYGSLNNALAVPDIPAGSRARIWLRRSVTAGVSNQNSIRVVMDWDYA